ncbi:MAG: alpha,alpha-trehalose-phosphate synthase (UDP-forming) [Microthrixaceae bacterium]
MADSSTKPVVIASNRGPISFSRRDGQLVGKRGSGGLVSGLAPLVESGRATWIAAAMSDADREATDAGGGVVEADGLRVTLLNIDAELQRRHYDDISNSTLWFVHHGLYDLVRSPAFDVDWWHSWDAYRLVNAAFAEAIVSSAPHGAIVLVQDYHLCLVARMARVERDDLRFVHFHHTPFAGPEEFRVLPPPVRSELLEGLASHDACGFHTSRWELNYQACQAELADQIGRTFHATLNSDLDDMRAVADSEPCLEAGKALEGRVGDRAVVARVDRMELSKNIARGFAAFDRLLEKRKDLHDKVVFIACCYPSRLGVEEYRRYRDEVLASAELVNERWGTPGWQPVELMTDDNFPRSVAVLKMYDVLLVNPIRDGLNLVAKEGPAVNERYGTLLLSTEAGAYAELDDEVVAVFPFDIEGTADAIGKALDLEPDQRRFKSSDLAEAVARRTPESWLRDQLRAV